MKRKYRLVTAAALLLAQQGFGDAAHYKDTLVGERASGLGGAYVAMSDDPSGVFHNPAGLIFSTDSYISASTNVYNSSKQTYKNIGTNANYTTSSQSLTPGLLGFTQDWGPGKFGFAIVSPNPESVDQSDNITLEAGHPTGAKQITRRFLRQDNVYLFGPAYSLEVSSNFSIGLSLLGSIRLLRSIDNTVAITQADKYFIDNSLFRSDEIGVIPKLGIQFMPVPKWALGLTIAKTLSVSGSFDLIRTLTKTNSDGSIPTPTGDFLSDFVTVEDRQRYVIASPISLSVGTAFFASRNFLLTGQVDIYEGRPVDAIAATWNVSGGAELFLTDSFALRGGVYTNNANTANVDPGRTNQRDHVDLLGGSFGMSYYRPSSSLTLGASYAAGTGQSQAFRDISTVYELHRTVMNIYLSGSYQL